MHWAPRRRPSIIISCQPADDLSDLAKAIRINEPIHQSIHPVSTFETDVIRGGKGESGASMSTFERCSWLMTVHGKQRQGGRDE